MIREGIVIQMSNNNYKPALKLLRMIPATAVSTYYSVISKEMEQPLDFETYDKLITRNQGVLNEQRHIVLMNIGAGFFETPVNVAMKIPDSNAIPI